MLTAAQLLFSTQAMTLINDLSQGDCIQAAALLPTHLFTRRYIFNRAGERSNLLYFIGRAFGFRTRRHTRIATGDTISVIVEHQNYSMKCMRDLLYMSRRSLHVGSVKAAVNLHGTRSWLGSDKILPPNTLMRNTHALAFDG